MKVLVGGSEPLSTVLRTARLLVNEVQQTWVLVDDGLPSNLQSLATRVDLSNFEAVLSAWERDTPAIYVTDQPLGDNWFSHEYGRVALISTFGFNMLDIPFPIVAYLVYQISQALLVFSLNWDGTNLSIAGHDPPVGCVFDQCAYKPDIRLGMASGRLCSRCYERLRDGGVSDTVLASAASIFGVVGQVETAPISSGDSEVQPMSEMLSILHLSDLHFGSAFRFAPKVLRPGNPLMLEPFGNLHTLHKMVLSDLERISTDVSLPVEGRALASGVDLIVISGDMTHTAGAKVAYPLRAGGPTDEYDQAVDFLQNLVAGINGIRGKSALNPIGFDRVVTIPGNHDVNWSAPPLTPQSFYGYAKFWKDLTGNTAYFGCEPNEIMFQGAWTVGDTKIVVCGFNSCTMSGEDERLRDIGIVERRQLALCDELLNSATGKTTRRIAVVHHHPVYLPSLAAENESYDAILQAGQFLSYLQNKGFDLILHGHKHYPTIWVQNMRPYEARDIRNWSDPVIVSSGSLSASGANLPSSVPNTYQLIGLRLVPDSLRPKCMVIRRALSRGDLLYNSRFEPDGVWHLGEDVSAAGQRMGGTSTPVTPALPPDSAKNLHEARDLRYQASWGWMLVHRFRRSQEAGQLFDISVYLTLHRRENMVEKAVRRVYYAVGDLWPGSPFVVEAAQNGFELRLSAFGPFLCVADLEFVDGTRTRLERYIDFEMADLFSDYGVSANPS